MGIERTVGPQFVPITMPTASTVDHRSCRERGTRHPRRSPSPASQHPDGRAGIRQTEIDPRLPTATVGNRLPGATKRGILCRHAR